MKKCLLVVVAVFTMLFVETVALADNETFDREMLNATGQLELWKAELAELVENISGENAADMVQYSSNVLSAIQGIALAYDSSVEPAETVLNEIAPRESRAWTEENGTLVQTPVYWSDELECYVSCDFLFRSGYLSGSFSLYTQKGDYLATQYLEIGQRNEELVVLVVDYDRIDDLTGRFAMKESNNHGNVIFTKTMGYYLDIVLDVDAWQRGQEIEWSKDLLLPAAVLYY